MKKLLWAILLTALLVPGLIMGCGEADSDTPPTKSDAAGLTSISLSGNAVTRVDYPAPIDSLEMDNYIGADTWAELPPEQSGVIYVTSVAGLTNSVVDVEASPNADVLHTDGNLSAAQVPLPDDFGFAPGDGGVSYSNNGFLYVQVTSESKKVVNTYRFQIRQANSNNNLSSVTVGGASATLGTPNAIWASVTAGSVTLAIGSASDVTVAVEKQANAQNAGVEFGKVTDGAEPEWTTASTFSFINGEILGIKVTAENLSVRYYKIVVEVGGSDATLDPTYTMVGGGAEQSPAYHGIVVDGERAASLGTPSANLASVEAGVVSVLHFFDRLPEEGIRVTATPNSSAASVMYATGASNAATLSFSADDMIKPAADDHRLFIQVVAGDGETTLYYKVELLYNKGGQIHYGTPVFASGVIDDKWLNPEIEEYRIWTMTTSRATSSGDTGKENNWAYVQNPNTFGIAKCMWDETGLYVFVRVADPGVFGGTSDPSSNGHTYDSVEVFINERVNSLGEVVTTPSSYSGKGGQYRISATGRRSADPTSLESGWGAGATATGNAKLGWTITAASEFAVEVNGVKQPGYIVTAKIPWRFATSSSGADSGATPPAPWPPVNNKKIGFDLQINACTAAGTRAGCMVWKNITTSNYQNCVNWGVATLVGKP